MKKIYAIILALVLALSFALAGCGNSKNEAATPKTTVMTSSIAPTTQKTTAQKTTKAQTRAARAQAHRSNVRKTTAAANNANDQGCINDDEAETW